MKKQSDLSRLLGYAGKRKYFSYASWVLAAFSALVSLALFYFIFNIRDEQNALISIYDLAVSFCKLKK